MEAQEQGQFWPFHDKAFANARQLHRDNFLAWAEELGLDTESFRQALDSGKWRQRIEADKILANELGVRSTPTFFINGRLLVGAKPFEQFKTRVEEELRRAQALLDQGVSREELYQKLIEAENPAPLTRPSR